MPPFEQSSFHLHLVSDATGETLVAVARAAKAQYAGIEGVEHVYPLVRSSKQLDRVLKEIEEEPGIVLYTLVEDDLILRLEERCRELGCPCLSVLTPVFQLLQAYLGTEQTNHPGAQHVLDADYFKRIDALNYTMAHDDGQYGGHLAEADVILVVVGVSRTSKTPTSIYLANRGVKTANVPLVPDLPPPFDLDTLTRPLIVGLVASPERIVAIRHNRVLGLEGAMPGRLQDGSYVDPDAVAAEITASRRFCARHGWPTIDVTRRSIEETAAAVMEMLVLHRQKRAAQA
jgi:regulator of PEP synthase PpsR (kinase-PPPase family)